MPDGRMEETDTGGEMAGPAGALGPQRGEPLAPGRIRRMLARFWASDTAVMLTLAAVVGTGGGFGAVVFIWVIGWTTRLFFDGGAHAFGFLGRGYVILLPLVGGLLVGPLVHFLAPEAKGHGVPEVMQAMATKGGRIRPVVIAVKAVGSAITIGSGGSVGREGPIVQIGAAFGSVLGQRFRLSQPRIIALIGSGAAAGIAATFNAPIAGVMFALEVLLGEYTVQAFSTMVFASVSASIVSRFFLGNHPAFAVPAYELKSAWELPLYVVLGLVAALAGGAFVRTLYFAEDAFDEWRFPPYLKPAVGGLALGVVGYFVPRVFGTGFPVIAEALNGSIALKILLVLIVAKILATSLTLGSGASGGVFAPALFLGAVVGGAYGTVAHHLFPSVVANSGAYATVGMAAVFAAAARAPITAIIILFEMTLDYNIMVPLMFATVVATVLAGWAEPESIYTLKLVRKGIDFRGRHRMTQMERIPVGEIMTPMNRMGAVRPDTTLTELADLFETTKHHGVPVLDDEGRLTGIVTIEDLERALANGSEDSVVSDIYKTNLMVAFPDESLEEVLRRAGGLNVGRIPVVDRDDPKQILGVLRRGDIIGALGSAFSSRHERERRGRRGRLEGVTRSRLVEFDISKDDGAVGRTLRELQPPPESLLVAIERKGRTLVPRGHTRLQAGDHIVALAPMDGGVRLRRRLREGPA